MRICTHCSMPMLAHENENGSPIWWCSSCSVAAPREVRNYKSLALRTLPFIIIGYLGVSCFGWITSSWHATCEQHKARSEDYAKVKTYIVFYSLDSYRCGGKLSDYLSSGKTVAKIYGVPFDVIKTDAETQSFVVKTSWRVIQDMTATYVSLVRGRIANKDD